MHAPTDQELMELLDRVALRDEPALRRLYECTCARLYGLALRILGHKDWAERMALVLAVSSSMDFISFSLRL